MASLRSTAIAYVERLGFPVFPVREGGKAPKTQHGFLDASIDLDQVGNWWSSSPNANIGIPVPRGYIVLDVDSEEALRALGYQGIEIPATVTAKTPRGYHFWFRCHEAVRPTVDIFPGVDVRALGSYVVVPPSRRSDGGVYAWTVAPRSSSFCDAPDWLLEASKGGALAEQASGEKPAILPSEVLSGVAEGNRDITLFRYACRLRSLGYDRTEAEVLVQHAASSCSPAFDPTEALAKVASAWKYEAPAQGHQGKVWEMPDLLSATFAETKWVVNKILPEGLAIVFSPAKVGKSFLLGATCHAVASGRVLMNGFLTSESGVLYLDLEQSEPMAQNRWKAIVGSKPVPGRLRTCFQWPRMDAGGEEKLDAYLTEHVDTRLVVIDVLAMFWPEKQPANAGNAYQWEYNKLSQLRTLTQKHSVAMILVHHTNRSTPHDPLDRANGTQAMTGVPDTIWVLSRDRSSNDGELYVTGKNVEEQRLELNFAPHLGGWSLRTPIYNISAGHSEDGEARDEDGFHA